MKLYEIKTIAKHTPAEYIGKEPKELGLHVVDTIGGFQPSGANWSYWAEILDNGATVVTVYNRIAGPNLNT